MSRRIFYASAGRANLIRSHEFWVRGENNPDEVSLTFSGQIQSFVAEIGGDALMVSECVDGRRIADGCFTIEHWPPAPPSSGLRYHLAELRKAWRMVRAARRFRADLAIVDSGALPFFMMALFRWAGMPVVVVLHNTIWAHGFRPRGGLRTAAVTALDSAFFRSVADAAIAVSPEAARQVDEIAPGHACLVAETRAQFERGYFDGIPPPPDWTAGPFNMMYIGRVDRTKGALDLPEMARRVEEALPGRVKWTVCGRGPDLEALRAAVADGLTHVVDVRGWTSLEDLLEVYARTHATIVPTRSDFAEGLAMTAAEAVLAGRPVVTNPVVPAHELLAPAVILGRTNDPASHAEAVVRLASDHALYERLRAATRSLGETFYDRTLGLTAVLHRVTGAIDARRR